MLDIQSNASIIESIINMEVQFSKYLKTLMMIFIHTPSFIPVLIISHLKRTWPFISASLKAFHQKC